MLTEMQIDSGEVVLRDVTLNSRLGAALATKSEKTDWWQLREGSSGKTTGDTRRTRRRRRRQRQRPAGIVMRSGCRATWSAINSDCLNRNREPQVTPPLNRRRLVLIGSTAKLDC
ncbi:unnamed protein product [Nippostrongylus brasiliensis]|uniref:Transposase n=1 Tax=Nippostrongylus brasiliensis TaxID=27835 RepID=A0A0N4XDA1_NIPBR|nr:unnamed protein product [Nippostrongylus brasiliensis]